MIAPTTTTQPAMIVIIGGSIGIFNVESIIPEPTAKETRTPTIHITTPTKLLLSFIFHLLLAFFSSPRCVM